MRADLTAEQLRAMLRVQLGLHMDTCTELVVTTVGGELTVRWTTVTENGRVMSTHSRELS